MSRVREYWIELETTRDTTPEKVAARLGVQLSGFADYGQARAAARDLYEHGVGVVSATLRGRVTNTTVNEMTYDHFSNQRAARKREAKKR